MTTEEFNLVLEDRITSIRATLGRKAEEYSRRGDRLWNFHSAARVNHCTPEQALWGMALKHLVSVQDLVDASPHSEPPLRAITDEKIGDLINYLILLEALFEERRIP